MSGNKKSRDNVAKSTALINAADIDLNFVVSNIFFHNTPGTHFRLGASCVDKIEVVLKLEKQQSPLVWTCTIKDIAEHGNAGIPRAAVLNVLKHALEKLTSDSSEGEEKEEKDDEEDQDCSERSADPSSKVYCHVPAEPTVSAQVQADGSIVMDLNIPVGGIPLAFTFHFLALDRQHIDIIESAVNDAKDEIAALRKEMEVIIGENCSLRQQLRQQRSNMIALRTNVLSPPNSLIPWTSVRVSTDDSSNRLFTRSEDNKYVLIHRPGVYAVHARIVTNESSGNRSLELHLDDAPVSVTYMGMNNGYWTAIELRDFVEIDGKCPRRVSVKWMGNNQMLHGNQGQADEKVTHFSIVRLS